MSGFDAQAQAGQIAMPLVIVNAASLRDALKQAYEAGAHSSESAQRQAREALAAVPLLPSVIDLPDDAAKWQRLKAWASLHFEWQDVALICAAPALFKELRRAADMLSAVAGDLEDGGSLDSLRGKYVTALVNARDDARAAIALAQPPAEREA